MPSKKPQEKILTLIPRPANHAIELTITRTIKTEITYTLRGGFLMTLI